MAWIIAAVAVIFIFVGVYRRTRPMTPEQFAEAAKRRIDEAHPDLSVKESDGLHFKITKNEEDTDIYWDNAYAVYRLNRRYCSQIIDDFLKAMTNTPSAPTTWEEAKPRLLPSLKSRAYVEETATVPGGAEALEKLVISNYNDELCVIIAIDSNLTIAFATKEQLEEWGVSPEEALNIAVDNLAKLTAPLWPDATESAQKHGLFALNTHDGYDASRLLLPDFYQRASQALGCERIAVGVPNRDFIVAFAADNPSLKKHVEKIKKDFAAYDHAISPNMIYLPN